MQHQFKQISAYISSFSPEHHMVRKTIDINEYGLTSITVAVVEPGPNSALEAMALQMNAYDWFQFTVKDLRQIIHNNLLKPAPMAVGYYEQFVDERIEDEWPGAASHTHRDVLVREFCERYLKLDMNAGLESLRVISFQLQTIIIVIDNTKGLLYFNPPVATRFAFLFCRSNEGEKMALEHCDIVTNIFKY